MEKYVSALIITFFVYGFVGWIWESFICPLATGHRFKNSGFLMGPVIPIYGVGAVAVSLLLSPQENYFSIFVEGAFVASVIEYFTSWVMEQLYHRRWWDYTDRAFNVNGRVCLEGFLIFGLFSVVAVKFIQPYLLSKIFQHGMVSLIIVATALTTVLLLDLIFTLISLAHLEQHLDEFIKYIEEYAQKALDGIEEGKKNLTDILDLMKINDLATYKELFKGKKRVDRRIIRAFPHLMNKKKK